MRVLHVMEATIGGTRRHIVDVARGQLRRGLDVSLCVAVEREPRFEVDLEALERQGARVRRLAMVRAIRPTRDLAHLRALEALVRAERPDVVHTHSSKAGVLGRLAALWAGSGARVHTPHSFAFLFADMFGPLARGVFRALESALAEVTDRVVAVSNSEADTFRRSGVVPAARIRVVPNGVDPGPWGAAAPLDRGQLDVPEGAPLAAVVGLLNVAKGQDLALRALVEPGCEELHLLVVGHGERGAEWERLARELGVAERVRWLGWREDVPALVAAADFALIPSRWEGMPYAALEAMAAGKPVVATPVDGAREVVVDGCTGFACEAISVAGIAASLRRALACDAAELNALGAAGRRRLLDRYSVDRMVDGLCAVYEEVA